MKALVKECPLCCGAGMHYKGMFGEESRIIEKCKTCNGKGVVE